MIDLRFLTAILAHLGSGDPECCRAALGVDGVAGLADCADFGMLELNAVVVAAGWNWASATWLAASIFLSSN